MATLDVSDQSLIVTIEGFDKVLSLRSTITIPLSQIAGVSARPDISKLMSMPVESRFLGVRHPGTVLAGTLTMADGSGAVFCDVHDEHKAIAIDLHHHEYKRLIIEVSGRTPEEARDFIVAAVGAPLPGTKHAVDENPDQPASARTGTAR